MQMDMTGYGGAQARRRATLLRTRRFAFVGAAAAGVALFLATALTFTAQNGTVSGLTISGSTSAVAVTDTLPGGVWFTSGGTKVPPSWAPVEGEPVSVTANGDLILIDASGKASTDTVTISVVLKNAADLDYSTFILPVGLREADSATTPASWSLPTGGETQYLTLTSPALDFQVPGGELYEVVVPAGTDAGLVVASDASGTLAPQFIIQAN